MPTKDTQKICFERKLSFGAVNARGFEDLSIITGGVEALGHGLYVDEKSITGLMGLLMGKTIPGYLTHKGLAQGDRLGQEIGLFSGFHRDGMKIKASQFSFLNSFKKHDAATHDKLVELAAEVPDQFGLSVVFDGEAVWVNEAGEDVPGSFAKPEKCKFEHPCIRFSGVESADFVKAPAANPDGLLAEKVDETGKVTMETISLAKHTEALDAAKAELTALSATHKAALEKLTADHVAALAAKDEAHKTELASKLVEAKTASDAALAEKDKALVEAQVFDIRKSGVTEAVAMAFKANASTSGTVSLPERGKTDSESWDIYAGLKAKSPAVAADFYDKYLSKIEKAKLR